MPESAGMGSAVDILFVLLDWLIAAITALERYWRNASVSNRHSTLDPSGDGEDARPPLQH